MAIRRIARMQGRRLTVFAYSYAAREIFSYARSRGWNTILGQIDPGPFEEKLVAELHGRSALKADWERAPTRYWDEWRIECDLADTIVVNSVWSYEGLRKAGIPGDKLALIPLVFEAPAAAHDFLRTYPSKFTGERRMRVLFLGQINLRKGAEPLFEAIRLLRHHPIEFWFVGPIQIEVPDDLKNVSFVRWFGPVPRSQTDDFFRAADVFVFPTFSDGFGLTQLEAGAWQMPVVASRNCGRVVNHEKLILEDVTARTIAARLEWCFENPGLLKSLAGEQSSPRESGITELGTRLNELVNNPCRS
jgi:glycosyltransferase involved in cell wall biosynthesis